MRTKTKKSHRRRKSKQTKRLRKQKGGGLYEDDVRNIFIENRYIMPRDKRCLDIGSRDGLNCITMAYFYAKEVIGIDIDDSRFHEMPLNDKVKLIKANLLDFVDEEGFDLITCFLWNMRTYEYDNIINKIKSLLKPGGHVLISVVDDVYKYGYYDKHTQKSFPHTGSVPELLEENFNIVNKIISPRTRALYLIASDPK